jgi:hypothetical protein
MWVCAKCGERSEDNFDSCWKCSTARGAVTGGNPPPRPPAWALRYEMFRAGPLTKWEALFQRAADFATSRGPDRVVSISHSSDGGDGVITVWYWAERSETTDDR